MKKFFSFFIACAVLLTGYAYFYNDSFSFFEGDTVKTNSSILTLDFGEIETSTNNNSLLNGKYTAKLKLFDLIPIKNASVKIIKNKNVVPLGKTFGVKLYTKGVIVVGMTDVITNEKSYNPAYDKGIRLGDNILTVNSKEVTSNEQLSSIVKNSNGKKLKVEVKRKNLEFSVDVTPAKSKSGSYQIGLWVRDSTAGIGTLTFYDPETKVFAGLGHSISDSDTGQIMPLQNGNVCKATINGAIKGKNGLPGELVGNFDEKIKYGSLCQNNKSGLFGISDNDLLDNKKTMKIALKSEIKTGKAQIICTIEGNKAEYFDIEIIKINNNLEQTKNMVIKINDDRLLNITGGIVQGMSGSPIIQNGKLVGAVTHVLVNDPTKGYGIFAENMLETVSDIANQNNV